MFRLFRGKRSAELVRLDSGGEVVKLERQEDGELLASRKRLEVARNEAEAARFEEMAALSRLTAQNTDTAAGFRNFEKVD